MSQSVTCVCCGSLTYFRYFVLCCFYALRYAVYQYISPILAVLVETQAQLLRLKGILLHSAQETKQH